MKVCHVTSAHPAEDIRIFHKECRSLAESGHDVSLVAFGEDKVAEGVRIIGLGDPPDSRYKRMLSGAKKAYLAAASINADLYHLHDPELLPYIHKLKKHGARVIFDSHEDVPAQIKDKTWIPSYLRQMASSVYKKLETHFVRGADAVVAATPFIAQKFEGRVARVITVNNYPMNDDITSDGESFQNRDRLVCYVGAINKNRGRDVMFEVSKKISGKLVLAGPIESGQTFPDNCDYLGILDRERINALLNQCQLGLVLLMPTESYVESQPIKMFEYMAAGIPVIASDFPRWREIVEGNECGRCVNPRDVSAIVKAIEDTLSDPLTSERMGRKGRLAVIEKYSWKVESEKLCLLYEDLQGFVLR